MEFHLSCCRNLSSSFIYIYGKNRRFFKTIYLLSFYRLKKRNVEGGKRMSTLAEDNEDSGITIKASNRDDNDGPDHLGFLP